MGLKNLKTFHPECVQQNAYSLFIGGDDCVITEKVDRFDRMIVEKVATVVLAIILDQLRYRLLTEEQ